MVTTLRQNAAKVRKFDEVDKFTEIEKGLNPKNPAFYYGELIYYFLLKKSLIFSL